MEFNEFLRQRLKELGLSFAGLQARLAEQDYNVTRAAVGHWVLGSRKPPIGDKEFMEILARALEMNYADLWEQTGLYTPLEERSPTAQRIAEIVDRMPPEKQDLALRIIEELAK
jgi:hypothetical protein